MNEFGKSITASLTGIVGAAAMGAVLGFESVLVGSILIVSVVAAVVWARRGLAKDGEDR